MKQHPRKMHQPQPRVAMAAEWAGYSDLITEVEDQLAEICGLDEEGRKSHDRASGPKHTMKTVAGDKGNQGRSSKPFSRSGG